MVSDASIFYTLAGEATGDSVRLLCLLVGVAGRRFEGLLLLCGGSGNVRDEDARRGRVPEAEPAALAGVIVMGIVTHVAASARALATEEVPVTFTSHCDDECTLLLE